MLKTRFTSIILLVLLFVFPHQSLAVEFSITNLKIDATLQNNGNVEVEETHTYDFDGEFNGITREVVPKEGASISQFTATENGKNLRIEKEDDLYKVHRKGEDETITVKLHYTIENGIEVYQDVAQFYWPFFDDRNDSSYEDLSITIHPPVSTDDVIAFGYDEAFTIQTIQENGSVLFKLGYVPSNTNADIRVAYPSSLFPNAPLTADKPMKEDILKAEQEHLKQAESDAKTKETLSTISSIGLPSFAIILFLLMLRDWLRARAMRNDFMREGATSLSVPKQIMSLPATIYFTNNNYLQPKAMGAALLDLVRKGFVTKVADDQFQRIRSKSPLNHENTLMELLFDKIGANHIFSLDDLIAYTKNTKNHIKYNTYQTEWRQAVKQEVDSHSLYENKTTYRLLIGFSSILLLPFIFFFLIYSLFFSFIVTVLLVITVIIYASVYRQKTVEGARIAYDWKQFKVRFKDLSQTEWEKWSEDDRMRAYIYGLGISSKEIDRKHDQLIEALTPTGNDYVDDGSFFSIIYIGPYASSSFHSAYQSSLSSGGDSGGGSSGGTGGGGGGSGAF
ncbi:putative membrane protein [Bacillus niacini]|uniref:Membrane protein n=1 Tax=Neobacillus niacini TaxID=86668 RepID=A0A852T419_9BACI|nr:DUF2207 domain-containing protein [Neobacillus niacini]NYE03303.1 putative membrane protein [Neobacillus niacini]